MTRAQTIVAALLLVVVLLVGCGAYVLTHLEVRGTPQPKCTIDQVRLGKC